MSKYIRGKKKPVSSQGYQNNVSQNQPGIGTTVRNPLSHAAVGLASMMLATTSGTAQEAATTTAPRSSTTTAQSSGQSSTTTLPQINVRSAKRKPRQQRPVQAATRTPPVAATALPPSQTSYQTPGNSNLNRIPVPLLRTPQSVNVVPQAVIRDQAASDVKDALRNVAGVTFRAGEGGNQGDTPYIRGFSAQNDIFRDGFRDPGWYTRDLFSVDALEVYKGPSSVLFGRGSTGGAVNLVSKLPTDRAFVEGTLTGNTGPGVRATVDANGKVNDQVSARIVAMGQRYDVPDRDNVEVNRYGFAPSIKYKIDNKTTNTFSYVYQHDDNVPDYGIPFLSGSFFGTPRPIAPVSRSSWYGILSGPYPDTERVDAHIVTNRFEHEFNSNFKVVNTTRYVNVDRFQRNVFPEPAPTSLNTAWTPNRAQIAVNNTMVANATDLIAKFNTGPLEHTTITGFEANRETRDFLRNQFSGQASTNLFDPNPWRYGGIPLNPTANQLTNGEATDLAFYAADQIKINQYFEVLGGIRLENYKFNQSATLADPRVQNLERNDNLLSWRVGGIFHPTLNSSIYVMHGTSFNPSADNLSVSVTTAANALSLVKLAPEKSETTEGGVKADVLDGKLSLAAAVFHTVKTNLRVPDPSDPTGAVQILNGEVTADGWEASATGYLTKQWQIITSYTYVHARITKTSSAFQLNAEPTNTPAHSFSLWTTYDVTPKFQVGAGVFYGGEVYGDLGSAAASQAALVPDWWRVDLMAAYKVSKQATLQFNLYNVGDTTYYGSAYSNWAVPASGRVFALTYRVRFEPDDAPKSASVLPVKAAALK